MNLKGYLKNQIYNFHKNALSQYIYKREINNRSKLPLTQIYSLSKHINMFLPFTQEIHQPNDWYGHAKIFKKFLNLPENYQFKFIIEHGTYLNNEVADIDLETNLPSFVTYSENRIKILKRYRDFAFSVGPFINYAEDILTQEEFNKEKRRLGKSLLLFPIHSTLDTDINFNITQLCNLVKKMGKKFNSVRVCLYWTDILRKNYQIYQDYGFETVTAGHILDPNFIPRLKSIIKLSSYTISNGISTHIAYCLALNKPHYLISQKLFLSGNKKEIKNNLIFRKSKEYREVFKEFSKNVEKITPKQYTIANRYWGLNNIKTKNEFLKIVKKTEEIFKDYK